MCCVLEPPGITNLIIPLPMSDFGRNTTSNAIYFAVRKSTDGKGRPCAVLVTKVPKGTPDARQAFKSDGSPSLDKDNNEVWQLEQEWLNGRIVKLENREVEIKQKKRFFLNITIQGEQHTMVLSLERGDRYWVDFLKRLLGVDLSLPVRFQPYHIIDRATGRPNQGILLSQGGAKIPQTWRKDNNWGNDVNGTGGMPPGRQFTNEKTGELDWTFRERDNWLEQRVYDRVRMELDAEASGTIIADVDDGPPPSAPSTAAPPAAAPPPAQASTHIYTPASSQIEDDDLPF